MLAQDFSAANLSFLPDSVLTVLWRTKFGQDPLLLFLFDKMAEKLGMRKNDAPVLAEQAFVMNSILEVLQKAPDLAEDFLGGSNVPPHLNYILIARDLIEDGEQSVIDALPQESLALLDQVHKIDDDPESYQGVLSLASFSYLLFEWQDLDILANRLITGQWSLEKDIDEIVEYYQGAVYIPLPVYLEEPTELEMEIARKIQEISFVINHHDHPDAIIYGYIDKIAQMHPEELTAEYLFNATGFCEAPVLMDPFQFAFDYCMQGSNRNPHLATHRFVMNSLHPTRLYSEYCGDGKATLDTLSLAMLYNYLKEDHEFRNEAIQRGSDEFKSLVSRAFPSLCPGIAPTTDPEMVKQIHMIRLAHVLFSLDYTSTLVSGERVMPIFIPQDMLHIYDQIDEALSLACPSHQLAHYRNDVVEGARNVYTALKEAFPEPELPVLPAKAIRHQNAQVLAFSPKNQ